MYVKTVLVSEMARPKGIPNARPSKSEIDNYFRLLRSAAKKGDVNAAAKLIELSQQPRAAQ